MKKKLSILIIIIIVIVVGIAFGLTRSRQTANIIIDDILAPTAAADYYEGENRLKVESGTATVKRSDGTEETVETETTVGMGDTIIVSEDGEATLYWFDDSISRLSGGTEITIDQADYNPENINETDIGFEVVSGEVWSKVQNLVDEDSEFLSYSGNIVAGVRGSTYNFIVKDELIEVDSIRHAAFVGQKDGDKKTIMSGRQALINKSKRFANLDQIMDVRGISKDKFQDYVENIQKDKRDLNMLNKKRIEKLRNKIGPLPGEPGYDKKMNLINKKLESIEDPDERAKLEVRVAQMHVQESMVQMMTKGELIGFMEQLESLIDRVELSGLPDKEKERLINEMKQNLAFADKMMDVSPGQRDLYEAKDTLRNMRIDLEGDAGKREWLENRLMEMRFYELNDWAKFNGFDPQQFEILVQRYFLGAERMQDFLRNNPEFKDAMASLMLELEGKPIDLEMLKLLMEQFQLTEEQLNALQNAINELEKIQPLLDAQPVPTLEIIQEAPYYQGPSPT